jgi:spore germination protein YaaH
MEATPISSSHPLPRRALAVLLAAIVGSSMALAPAVAVASPASPAGPGATITLAGANGHGAADDPTPPDPSDSPSIQYLEAEEHAADKVDFEPGGQVTVPFSPRGEDQWAVDGHAPQKLPAGHATGAQMRSEHAASFWADGAPPDLAGDGSSPVDEPSTDGVPVADAKPASAIGPQAAAGATGAMAVGASGLRREVFGFLPYWTLGASTTVLDWHTLSTVAYFSVGCLQSGYLDKTKPDGSATSGWGGWTSSKMTTLISTAHQNHTRVVLSVSCFAWSSAGATRQARLLGSATARSNLARSVAAAVRDRGADGVNLDFEPIATGYADEFTSLVRSIRSELNKVAPGYQLTFDAMGSIGNQPIAAATAAGAADAVLVMGYDYRTASSAVAGSISPLTGPHYNLNDTVAAFTADTSPSKVILGIPYYGRAWSTASSGVEAATLDQNRYGSSAAPTYAQAMDLAQLHGRRYDAVEQAPWTAYRKSTCTATYGCQTSWRELYYDDAASLGLRYDLVNRASLRGVGIWALGYDGTRGELRAELAKKFLTDTTAPLAGIGTLAPQQGDELFRVSWAGWDDSAIARFDVQVSATGGGWAAWLSGVAGTSAMYQGVNGRTYAFRVRATDVHGNVSGWRSLDVAHLGAPSSITVGGFATVRTDGLRMRAAPTTTASILTTLSAGDALQVLGGPVSAEGYTWYKVAGPVRQWSPVDPMQVGGWVAAVGSGATNLVARRPVYATQVTAGIVGMQLAGGGDRSLTPNGDGSQDAIRVTWTNRIAFQTMRLRVFRTDGTMAGSVALGAAGVGGHGYSWNGRLGGSIVPAGVYVLQIQGLRGGTAYSAPSAAPVSGAQIARFGVIVGKAAATSVTFKGPTSPTTAGTLLWTLTFGGPIAGLTAADFARSGTSTGCVLGTPVGAGAVWTMTLTRCGRGTVVLALRARAVMDAVHDLGPAKQTSAPTVLIDRIAPVSTGPRTSLRLGVALASAATSAVLMANLAWSATDPGGAGVRSYDVNASTDGAAFIGFASNLTTPSLTVALLPGHSYRFEVRARDNAGNVGGWVAGSLVRAYLPQETTSGPVWSAGWKTASVAQCSGGTVRYASAAGARVTHVFTGRAIGWVTTLGPDRGAAKVYVDGVLVATVDLHAAATAYRRVAFATSWSASGTHTLRIIVVGTAGRPRVDVDAFEIVR